MHTCPCGREHEWDPDCPDHPRNAGAVRTAILLGAEYEQDERGRWSIKGIAHKSDTQVFPAWMFLLTHGLGIDEHGTPKPFKDIKEGPPSRGESFRQTGLIMEGVDDASKRTQ